MSDASVASDLHQSLDVEGSFSSQVTFYDVIAFDYLSDLSGIFLGQILNSDVWIYVRFSEDILRRLQTNTINIVRPISIPLSLGRSTPAILAISSSFPIFHHHSGGDIDRGCNFE